MLLLKKKKKKTDFVVSQGGSLGTKGSQNALLQHFLDLFNELQLTQRMNVCMPEMVCKYTKHRILLKSYFYIKNSCKCCILFHMFQYKRTDVLYCLSTSKIDTLITSYTSFVPLGKYVPSLRSTAWMMGT